MQLPVFGPDVAGAIVDALIENPMQGRDSLAKRLGYSRDAVGRVVDLYRKDGMTREEIVERYAARARGIAPVTTTARPVERVESSGKGIKRDWWSDFGKVVYDSDVSGEGRKWLVLDTLPENILAAACMQAPFHHVSFLNFLARVKAGVDSSGGDVFPILGGDILDILVGKPEYKNPNSPSGVQEVEMGIDFIAELARIFPRAIVLTSNHLEDRLAEAQKRSALPDVFMRQWRDVYGVPDGWKIVDYLVLDNFFFEHGHQIGKGSKAGIREETVRRLRRFNSGGKTVIRAHRHTLAGPISAGEWESQTFCRQIHYMGCGMEDDKVSYNRAGLWNTMLHIRDGAVVPYPMEIGIDGNWTGRIINGFTGRAPRW